MSSQPTPRIPSTGLPTGVQPGPLGKRFVAQLIDAGVPTVLSLVAAAISGALDPGAGRVVVTLLGAVLVLAWLIVVWWMSATKAAGPGMRLMKLQLVGLRDGRSIGWGRFFVRQLVLALLAVTVIGLILLVVFMLQQPRRQGWHDLAAGSVVIKQRALAPVSAGRTAAKQTAPAATPPPVRPEQPAQPAPAPATTRTAPEAAPLAAPMSTADSVRMRPRRVGPGAELSRPEATRTRVEEAPVDDGRPLELGWVAVLDDDREVEVLGLVLLGRNPQARPGEDDAELIKVADDTRTVSKTHLSLRVDANGLFVMDRGSTNGTTLTDSTGASRPCPAGDVVPVRADSIVSFGDHWLRVEHRG
ncbi:MAG: RDD family protein [Propionibacteriaceae bacterium]